MNEVRRHEDYQERYLKSQLVKTLHTEGYYDAKISYQDKNGQLNVGVGKYLTDKVYLKFEKGTGKNDGAGVFWKWGY